MTLALALTPPLSQQVQGIYYNTSLTISADASLPTCIEGGDVAPAWSWSIVSINGAAPSADAPPLLSAEDAAKPTLILSGAKLPTGILVLQVQGCIGTDSDTLTRGLSLSRSLSLTVIQTPPLPEPRPEA